jgi:predicted SnoaL-like aldol condensation-catalyzing enzyme
VESNIHWNSGNRIAMNKTTRRLKTVVTILLTLVPAIATVAVAYMQIEAEKERSWARVDMFRDMEEERCEHEDRIQIQGRGLSSR